MLILSSRVEEHCLAGLSEIIANLSSLGAQLLSIASNCLSRATCGLAHTIHITIHYGLTLPQSRQ